MTVMVIGGRRTKVNRGAVIARWSIIKGRGPVIRLRVRVGSWTLVHVEYNALRNFVLRSEPAAGAEDGRLNELVGVSRECSNDVIIRTEIMESAIRVTKNLQGQRYCPDMLAIGFNLHVWLIGLNFDQVRHSAIRSPLRARRDSIASGQDTER